MSIRSLPPRNWCGTVGSGSGAGSAFGSSFDSSAGFASFAASGSASAGFSGSAFVSFSSGVGSASGPSSGFGVSAMATCSPAGVAGSRVPKGTSATQYRLLCVPAGASFSTFTWKTNSSCPGASIRGSAEHFGGRPCSVTLAGSAYASL